MSFSGTVKSFNPMKGFGFIDCQGTDLFVHIRDCQGGTPKQGDVVSFDIAESERKPGAKVANNVTGGTAAMKGVMGNGSCRGTVKSFNAMKGFGFIEYEGVDVFVHIKDCEGGAPVQGDMVAFEIEDSPQKPGSKKASQVTGGTGNMEPAGGGKGAWGDMGTMGGGGYGPAWGGKGGWDSSPYGMGGKGGGKGWGGGKGYW